MTPRGRIVQNLLRGVCFVCLTLPAAFGENTPVATVETEGFSPGQGLAARTRALAAAERDAVLLYTTGLLEKPEVGAARPVVDDFNTYVQSSRIVSESEVDGGIRVTAQVYLNELELRREIARLIFPTLPTQPVVVLLIAEEIPGARYLSVGNAGVSEETLRAGYEQSGFRVIPPTVLAERYTQDALLGRARGDLAGAARFALENQAHVVAVGQGRVLATPVNANESVFRATASLTVHILNARSARVYDAIRTEATVHGPSPAEAGRAALLDASAKAAQRAVVGGVLAMASVNPENAISLTILEGTDRVLMTEIQKAIAAIPGAADVELLRVSEEGALLTLRYAGEIKDLVDALSAVGARGARLWPYRVVADELVFKLRSPASRD